MDTSALKISVLFLLLVFGISEVSSKNNRIKIIVPHKISIIHHHHSRVADLKPKKKLHCYVHDMLKLNQSHEEEDSEVDASEEGRFGHSLGEADEAYQLSNAYHAFPTPAFSKAVRVYTRPVFLHKDSYDRRRPPRYEYHKYENYNYPEESSQENSHRVKGFHYK